MIPLNDLRLRAENEALRAEKEAALQLLKETCCFVSIDCINALQWEQTFPIAAEIYFAADDHDSNNPWRVQARSLLKRINRMIALNTDPETETEENAT